jgi:hypothetical protein
MFYPAFILLMVSAYTGMTSQANTVDVALGDTRTVRNCSITIHAFGYRSEQLDGIVTAAVREVGMLAAAIYVGYSIFIVGGSEMAFRTVAFLWYHGSSSHMHGMALQTSWRIHRPLMHNGAHEPRRPVSYTHLTLPTN